MSEEEKKMGAPAEDETAALFVTARKKQLAEQEAQRKADEEKAKRDAAEAEVRRLEEEIEARKLKAQEEERRLQEEEMNPSAQPGTGGRRSKKTMSKGAKIGLIAGVSVMGLCTLFLVFMFAIVLFTSNISDDQAEAWYQGMSITVDDYKLLSGSDQEKLMAYLASLYKYNESEVLTVTADQINDSLLGVSNSERYSLFNLVFADSKINPNEYIYGLEAELEDHLSFLTCSPDQFRRWKLPSQRACVNLMAKYSGYASDNDHLLKMTLQMDAFVPRCPDGEKETEGVMFRQFCELAALDNWEAVYTQAQNAVQTAIDSQPVELITYTDDEYGISFEYTSKMDLLENVTSQPGEIAGVRIGDACVMFFNIDHDFDYMQAVGPEAYLIESLDSILEELFPALYNVAYSGKHDEIEILESKSSSPIRISCDHYYAEDYSRYVYALVNRQNNPDSYYVILVLREGDNDNDRLATNDIIRSFHTIPSNG